MLKVSARNAIAGYVPCSVCNTLSVVHFFASGKKSKIPYLSCHGCGKTIQTKGTKEHIIENYSPTLQAYAEKHGVDVSAELEQIKANCWTENPAEYDVKINGIKNDEPLQQDEIKAKPSFDFDVMEPVTEPVTGGDVTEPVTVNQSGEKVEDEKPKDKKAGGGSMGLVLGAVVVVLVLGGVAYLVTKKRSGVAVSDDKGASDE